MPRNPEMGGSSEESEPNEYEQRKSKEIELLRTQPELFRSFESLGQMRRDFEIRTERDIYPKEIDTWYMGSIDKVQGLALEKIKPIDTDVSITELSNPRLETLIDLGKISKDKEEKGEDDSNQAKRKILYNAVKGGYSKLMMERDYKILDYMEERDDKKDNAFRESLSDLENLVDEQIGNKSEKEK